MEHRKVTLQDIADELGITKGTVDRAVHNRPGVSHDTRMRVLGLIEKYSYKPDRIARSLSLRAKKLRIGVIYEREFAFFWDKVESGIRAAGRELADFGVEVLCRRLDRERNADELLRQMDGLLAEGIDALALVPLDDPAVRAKIDETAARGIPVATLNDDIEGSRRLFYVGPQIGQGGRAAADLMGRMMGGRGRVFLVGYRLQSFEYEERLQGFRECLRQHFPGIGLAGRFVYDIADVPQSSRGLREALLAAGSVDGVYDGTSFLVEVARVVRSVPALQKAVLIGHELSDGVKPLIADGTVTATISQDPFSQGHSVIRMLYDTLSDGKVPEFARMYTRLDIIMRENLSLQNNIINPY